MSRILLTVMGAGKMYGMNKSAMMAREKWSGIIQGLRTSRWWRDVGPSGRFRHTRSFPGGANCWGWRSSRMSIIAMIAVLVTGVSVSCTSQGIPAVVNGTPVVIGGSEPIYMDIPGQHISLDLCGVASLADVDLVAWACEHNYNVNIVNLGGDTPLHCVGSRSLDIKNLIEAQGMSWDDNRPREVVFILVKHGASVDKCNRVGMTPLHVAALAGNPSVVSALIESGADVNATVGRSGYAVLHLAVAGSNLDVVKVLIRHRADVNVKEPGHGMTPLHLAVMRGASEMAKALVDGGADTGAQSNSGETAEQLARRLGSSYYGERHCFDAHVTYAA